MEIGENDDVKSMTEKMSKEPDIEFAVPNHKIKLSLEINKISALMCITFCFQATRSTDIISKIKANVTLIKGLSGKTSTAGIVDAFRCVR